MKPKSLRAILSAYKRNGYELDERPFAMNIFGIRANSTESNKFDDILGYIYKDGKGKWNVVQNAGTTDTGTYYLKTPFRGQMGAALLVAGQYKNTYAIDYHYSYLAFVQKQPVEVYRDYNRDAILDFDTTTKQVGLFGINLHRAYQVGKTYVIDKYSAGCQVWQDADEFNAALKFGKEAMARYGNKFTYTLFDERADFRRGLAKLVTFGGFAGVGYFSYKYIDKIFK